MSAITTRGLIDAFGVIAAAIEADKDRLCQLDGVIGDADHGVTMSIGFSAVTDALHKLDAAAVDPTTVFNTAAKSFLNAVGASSGPLYATAFMRAAAAVKGRTALDCGDLAAVVSAIAKGIQDRGKGEPGDKTMLDACFPPPMRSRPPPRRASRWRMASPAPSRPPRRGPRPPKPWWRPRVAPHALGSGRSVTWTPAPASTVTILQALLSAVRR